MLLQVEAAGEFQGCVNPNHCAAMRLSCRNVSSRPFSSPNLVCQMCNQSSLEKNIFNRSEKLRANIRSDKKLVQQQMDSSKSPQPSDELTELQKQWDRFAEVYAKTYTSFTTVLQHNVIINLQLATAKRILEIGAGPGNSTRLIIDELTAKNPNSPQCELIASDYSPEMVERLKQSIDVDPKCTENLPGKITAQLIDARRLPFADGSFDRYFAGLCIQLIPEYEACIQEAARVLVKGGLVGFSVIGREEHCTFFSVPDKIVKEVLGNEMPLGAAGLGPPIATRATDKKPHSNFDCGRDPNDLIDMCKRAGFSRAAYWYAQVCAFTGFEESALPAVLGTTTAWDLFNKLPESIREERVKQVGQRLMEIEEPLIFEALCVIAVK